VEPVSSPQAWLVRQMWQVTDNSMGSSEAALPRYRRQFSVRIHGFAKMFGRWSRSTKQHLNPSRHLSRHLRLAEYQFLFKHKRQNQHADYIMGQLQLLFRSF
jgi:hypothetical protein